MSIVNCTLLRECEYKFGCSLTQIITDEFNYICIYNTTKDNELLNCYANDVHLHSKK